MATPKRHTAFKVWIRDILNAPYTKQEGWDPNYIEIEGTQISRVNLLASVVGKFAAEDGNFSSITLDDGTETIRSKAFGPDVSKFNAVEIGQIVRIVGKVKEYNEEVYLAPEVVKPIEDPNWIILQKLELGEPKLREKAPTPEPKPSLGETPKESGEVEGGTGPSVEEAEGEKVEKIEDSEPAKKETPKKEEKPVEEKPAEEPKEESPKEEKKEEKPTEEAPSGKILKLIKKHDGGSGADMKKVTAESGLTEDECKNVLVDLLKSGEIFEPKKGMLKVLE